MASPAAVTMDPRTELEAFVRDRRRLLVAMAAALTPVPGEAEDLVQETLATAFAGLDRFDGRRPIGPWLRGILRHKALERMRASRMPTVDGAFLDSLERIHDRLDAHALDRLRDCVRALPDHERLAVERFYLAGRPSERAAADLGIGHDALRKRLQRAREGLARCLGRNLGD